MNLDDRIATLLKTENWSSLAGFDEAGRGPLAGPVYAGCVIIPEASMVEGLNDSKVLSEKKRDALFEKITRDFFWGVGWVWPAEIEKINIHYASLKAMKLAYEDLGQRYPEAAKKVRYGFSDGKFVPGVDFACLAQVKGDALISQISAASIVAKVLRDRYMIEQDLVYPEYGFAIHKGYPSPAHKKAIAEFGPCPIHRLSWLRPKLPEPS